MELSGRSALVDFFRRGEVARDVRKMAARGALPVAASDQLTLLVLLIDDPDPDVAQTAARTLDSIPSPALAAFLARQDTPPELRTCFGARGVSPGETPAPTDEPLVAVEDEPQGEAKTTGKSRQPLSLMPVTDRLKLAMRGTREQRSLLVRDPNKIVALAVLSSPKITETEIESIARMTSVSEEVLRTIGSNRSWLRSYAITSALARNPKTPVTLSLNLVSRLNAQDIKVMTSDRNLPEPVRRAAIKTLAARRGKS